MAVVVGGGLVVRAKNRPPPPARYVTAMPTQGDVAEKVQATGAVQPVLQVNVGSQVNGRVAKVLVDFNSVVKKGDVLAEIDSTQYGQQVSQVSAQLSAQRANLESAKANAEAARIAFERTQRLNQQSLASKGELDTASGQYEVAKAQVASAQAQIGAIQAQLSQQQTNVGWTKIYSPVDGVVVSRSIDPGATVVASFQAPVLFVIAQDLRRMRVMADVDEADVGKLKEGMEAEAVVDAFPGESFRGKVEQVRFSPNNVQGVVTYSAVVEVENPEEKLRPGMTATVTIKTREAKGVVRLPNAALRYKPTPPLGPNGKPVPQPPEAPLTKGTGRVFVMTSDKPGDEKSEARLVQIGVTDGMQTEVVSGLTIGTKVVTDETDDADPTKAKKGRMF
ncbi:efflux RND transporter periplasmic adaptor subunit [Labilithrix luteola]|uniref:efflux RND transporter periplasmic adaptor subunit n=1 Tax=Labilithrix luteola TaxID=1391654 RepID=UPI001F0B43F1|nr:efflux RND transporter periplasmic adaptor subunit [Labilithrix luteola]